MLARCQELRLSGSPEEGEQTAYPPSVGLLGDEGVQCMPKRGPDTLPRGRGLRELGGADCPEPTERCLISCEPHYTLPGMLVFGSRSPSQASEQWSRCLSHPLVLQCHHRRRMVALVLGQALLELPVCNWPRDTRSSSGWAALARQLHVCLRDGSQTTVLVHTEISVISHLSTLKCVLCAWCWAPQGTQTCSLP